MHPTAQPIKLSFEGDLVSATFLSSTTACVGFVSGVHGDVDCDADVSSSSSLRDHCPEGLYLSLTPGDASLWVAVLFIRKGTT